MVFLGDGQRLLLLHLRLVVRQPSVLPVHPASKFIEELHVQAPEADLEGDDHLGVVHPLDVPQVQLAIHFQRPTFRLQLFLGEYIWIQTFVPK